MLEIKTFDKLVKDAIDLRYEVFINEQKFTIEIDDLDPICTHLVLYEDTKPIGVCRYYEQDGIYHFGRLAIKIDKRKYGYATLLLKEAEKQIYQKGGKKLLLSAQLRVKDFYIKNGYKQISDIYYDEYCEHIDMEKQLYAPRFIRKATLQDADTIVTLFNLSRQKMKEIGNETQWTDLYPDYIDVEEDVNKDQGYVLCNENEILAYFAFVIGEDKTYAYIENGKWNYNETYGTLHRLASNQKENNIFMDVFNFAKTKIDYIRSDTHANNKIMLRNLQKNGFTYCGTIYVENGTPRDAYDYKKETIK